MPLLDEGSACSFALSCFSIWSRREDLSAISRFMILMLLDCVEKGLYDLLPGTSENVAVSVVEGCANNY